MIGADLLPHLVDVVNPARVTDRYGNEVDDWTNAARQPVRAWLQLNTGAENTEQRDAQIGEWLMIANPSGVDGQPLVVTGSSRVEWGELRFEVIGPPGPAHTPAALHHYEVRLRVVEG